MHKNIYTHRIQFRESDAYGLFSVFVRGEVPCLACHLPCVTYRGGGHTAAATRVVQTEYFMWRKHRRRNK